MPLEDLGRLSELFASGPAPCRPRASSRGALGGGHPEQCLGGPRLGQVEGARCRPGVVSAENTGSAESVSVSQSRGRLSRRGAWPAP
jgi:hypothetical protein